jgi:hypothetical protein
MRNLGGKQRRKDEKELCGITAVTRGEAQRHRDTLHASGSETGATIMEKLLARGFVDDTAYPPLAMLHAP